MIATTVVHPHRDTYATHNDAKKHTTELYMKFLSHYCKQRQIAGVAESLGPNCFLISFFTVKKYYYVHSATPAIYLNEFR